MAHKHSRQLGSLEHPVGMLQGSLESVVVESAVLDEPEGNCAPPAIQKIKGKQVSLKSAAVSQQICLRACRLSRLKLGGTRERGNAFGLLMLT